MNKKIPARFSVWRILISEHILYTMTELYPKLNENEMKDAGDTFRIQKINEINSFFEKEVDHYRNVLIKYKKVCSVIDWLNISSAIGSTALGLGTIGLVSFAILPPVAIALEGVAIGVCFSSILFGIINKKLMHKIEKHKAIYTCAVTKLNTVHDIYSKALEDGKIDTTEFKLILDEKDKYIALKNAIRKQSLDSEQKINIEEIQKEFLEKGKQLGKNEVLEKLKSSV